MDELVEKVRQALAAEYSGAGDGRIRDVPDRRAIRWYTTIGLVDRPLGMRGRTALYGPRHLQQLVAIKRRQALGRSLSQIQGELNWVSDEALAELSRVPEELLETPGPAPEGTADERHMRFWARQPVAAAAPANREALPSHEAPPHREAPANREAPPNHEAPADRDLSRMAQPSAARPATARPVNGVVLPGGVILLVPHPISERDRADIAAAAAPLLDLLDARGLLDGSSA
jgi:DNA-binding transcriptional MerR regulator